MKKTKEVKILYTNWQGETAIRRIIPKEIVFSSSKWHPETQWLLIAGDLDKKQSRQFAIKDIKAWFTN